MSSWLHSPFRISLPVKRPLSTGSQETLGNKDGGLKVELLTPCTNVKVTHKKSQGFLLFLELVKIFPLLFSPYPPPLSFSLQQLHYFLAFDGWWFFFPAQEEEKRGGTKNRLTGWRCFSPFPSFFLLFVSRLLRFLSLYSFPLLLMMNRYFLISFLRRGR